MTKRLSGKGHGFAQRGLDRRSGFGNPPSAAADGPPPASVGALLGAARVQMSQSVEDVAAALRIRRIFIAAMEADRFDDLPGPPYAVGFLRSYASYLGLDADEIVKLYRRNTPTPTAQETPLILPRPDARDFRWPGGGLVMIAAVVAVVTYGGWYYVYGTDAEPVATVIPDLPALPETAPVATAAAEKPSPNRPGQGDAGSADVALATPPEAPEAMPRSETRAAGTTAADTAGSTPGDDATGDGSTADGSTAGGPTATAVPAPGSSSASRPTAPPRAERSPASAQAAAIDTDLGIVIEATHDSWVQIRGSGDRPVITRVLRRGERYVVPNAPGLFLDTGNAGGISIVVNGNRLPPLGRFGEIRRNILLDSAALIERLRQ